MSGNHRRLDANRQENTLFTRSDLFTVLAAVPPLGVSIFLPTHVRGSEVRQGPIRLKNLISQAHNGLLAAGLSAAQADAFMAPAASLIDDYPFWQHQDQGLVLFLDSDREHHYQVPIPLSEQVVVGPGFHVRPLLPILAADGAFCVLTITAGSVRLFDASRFALVEADSSDLPENLSDDLGEPDYENPVQASPVARPHTGSISISNAQVYGDSPAEWRKSRLVEFARRVATAVERRLAVNPVPLVLVADAEVGGHFRKLSTLGPLLAGVIEANPESMDQQQLHEAAYTVMRPRLDAGPVEAVERCQALLGSEDPRATTSTEDLVRAAYQGRVDTAFLSEDETVSGSYDEANDQIVNGDGPQAGDLLEAVAVQTLQHGGAVHLLSRAKVPGPGPAAAVLRY